MEAKVDSVVKNEIKTNIQKSIQRVEVKTKKSRNLRFVNGFWIASVIKKIIKGIIIKSEEEINSGEKKLFSL